METKENCYFRALYQVAVTINSSLEPKDVLKSIAQSTANSMKAKGCAIMLLSPDRRELRHSVDYGLSDQYVQKGPVIVDRSLAEVLRGHPVAILDATTDPRCQYRDEAREEGIASILGVPIRYRGEVIGVMRVYTAESREFSPEEVELVEAIANLGAIALENARRHEEMKDNYDMIARYVYSDNWVAQMWETAKQA